MTKRKNLDLQTCPRLKHDRSISNEWYGPQRSQMGRHIEADYLSPVMQQYNEAAQNIESHSRYDEKINSYNLICMIPQKALPRL